MIKRAICISAQINNKEIYKESCKTIYNEVMRLAVVNSIIEKHKKNVSKVERAYEIKILCLKKLKRKEGIKNNQLELAELLDCYDNDILFIFKGLLNERAGASIRNLIAHGMVGEAAANSGIYVYFAGAVIKLLSYTSRKCKDLIKGNPKLQSFVSPGKDAIKIKRVK